MRRGGAIALAAIVLTQVGLADERSTAARQGPGPAVLVTHDGDGSSGRPCGDVIPRLGRGFVAGGCPVHANSLRVRLRLRTAFGAMRFAECATDFDVTFSATGEIWMDNLRFGGPSPCNDVWPCAPPEVIALRKSVAQGPPRDRVRPWRGRLVGWRAGGAQARIAICVDTCAGRYQGDLDVRFEPDGADSWKMRASTAGVGTGGLEIDGEWDVLTPDLTDDARFGLAPAPGG